MKSNKWLNRNIFSMGLTSFFSDFGHEMATAILPSFLISVGGNAALLGVIEGIADGSISLMKILGGWYSDFIGKRKPFAVVGYFLTALGVGSLALVFSWPGILASRCLAWMGRGIREPARDALLADSTEPKSYGKVFGFHRAMDTLGAVVGPAIAYILIKVIPLRSIFLVALLPSILAFLVITLFVKEVKKSSNSSNKLLISIKKLPTNFRSFLLAVGIFGLGNFADSLFILRATELLTPAHGTGVASGLAIILYTLRNIFYAGFSFPIGSLADKIGKKGLLAFGYLLTGISALGFAFAWSNLMYLGLFFLLAGIAIAITDALERTVAADLLPADLRGIGYGTLATVNGIGDFASSTIVGFLWVAISPLAGFGYGAIICTLGAIMLLLTRRQ